MLVKVKSWESMFGKQCQIKIISKKSRDIFIELMDAIFYISMSEILNLMVNNAIILINHIQALLIRLSGYQILLLKSKNKSQIIMKTQLNMNSMIDECQREKATRNRLMTMIPIHQVSSHKKNDMTSTIRVNIYTFSMFPHYSIFVIL